MVSVLYSVALAAPSTQLNFICHHWWYITMQYVWYVFNRPLVEIFSYQPVTLYDMNGCYKVEYNCSYMIPFMCNESSTSYLEMFFVWCWKSLILLFYDRKFTDRLIMNLRSDNISYLAYNMPWKTNPFIEMTILNSQTWGHNSKGSTPLTK